jgi:hypothetical protein
MGRGAAKQAKQNAQAGYDQNQTYTGRGSDIYDSLYPQLQQRAQNGLDPATKAEFNTASQQSLGGSNAGAAGQGDLMAARTRNAGGATAAIAESARSGQRQESTNALNTEKLSEQVKQQALAAMQGLYGTNTQAGVESLNASTGGVNAWTNADQQTMANTKMWLDFAQKAASGAMPTSGG